MMIGTQMLVDYLVIIYSNIQKLPETILVSVTFEGLKY